MRLLKVKVDGAELFKNCLFELDFIATDRVPRDDEGNISDVTPVCEKSSVYTENVIGMVGVNASGKTTALNIIRFILGYMSCVDLRPKMTNWGEWHLACLSRACSTRGIPSTL